MVGGLSAAALLGAGCGEATDYSETYDVNIVCDDNTMPIVGETEVHQGWGQRTAAIDVMCIGENGSVSAPTFLELDSSSAVDNLDELQITIERFDKGPIRGLSAEISENKGTVKLVHVQELVSAEIVEGGE